MTWEKIEGAPRWLEVRHGARKTSYRIKFRADGINLEKTLGEFPDWKKAKREGETLLAEARLKGTPTDPMLVRCEELAAELTEISKSRSEKTYLWTEGTFRLHLTPWLNANCAYAKDLNGTTWLNYRAYLRRNCPTVTLKAHYEIFAKLCRYAREKGIIKSKFKLDYDRERDDFKEDGMVIPDADIVKMLKAEPVPRTGSGKATYAVELHYFRAWRDRIVLQRATGMRPGEVRNLRKDRVEIRTHEVKPGRFVTYAVIRLQKQDTKTRQARTVPVEHHLAVAIIQSRLEGDSPWLFPSLKNKAKALDGSTKGWHAILKRAKVNPKYTPHDLRHTYLTHMFKRPGINHALVCANCGLSLEEAQKTYLHFTEEDIRVVAKDAAVALAFLRGAT
jgi:integrase